MEVRKLTIKQILLLSEAISRRHSGRLVANANTVRTAIWAKKNDFQKFITGLKDIGRGLKIKPKEISLENLGFENRSKKE